MEENNESKWLDGSCWNELSVICSEQFNNLAFLKLSSHINLPKLGINS